jgi:hypothetical protein
MMIVADTGGNNMVEHKKTNWTEKEDEQLTRMVRNKVPYKQIAKRLNRSHSAVTGRVHTLKKREVEMRKAGVLTRARTPWSDADTATMLEMKQNGSSDEQIGAALGRTKHAITVRLGRVRRAKPETETTPIQPTATVTGTEAIDFITEAVIERAVPELMGRFREEMNGHWNDLVKSVVGELKPMMLDSINKAVQQEFALATQVEEPEPKPTRAERRAERRAAKKQAKIERLQQRIQEMND